MESRSAKLLELEAVNARIRVGKRLIAEQELRIERLRTLGVDERPPTNLLQQFKFSLELLTSTRARLLREIHGLVPS